MPSCFQCDGDLGALRKVSREELCPSCGAWVHACKNCRFWAASARTCEEPAADWVHDREHTNFCDFFALRSPDMEQESGRSDSSSGRAAFDSLFKK